MKVKKHYWIKCPKCRKKNFKLEESVEVEGVLEIHCNHCGMTFKWEKEVK